MSFDEDKYKYLNLTPRTHISVETTKNDFSQKADLIKKNKYKYDKVDEGLNKLIYLGKIIKNYFPHKEQYIRRRELFNLKNLSNNKLTPFQIYLKKKKIISEKLNSKRNFEPKLKTIKSEKTFKSRCNNNKNIFITKSTKRLNTPIIYNNTTECYFKNKFIKSAVEQSNKNTKNNWQFKTLALTETNFSSKEHNKDRNDLNKFRYLLSISNFVKNKSKKNMNDFRYEKDKMLLLNKEKILKKKKNINLFNEIKSSQDNVDTKTAKTITEEYYKIPHHEIPLIDLSNFSKKNNQFYNFIIRNNLKSIISNRNKK